jgi:hypothetical protein
MTLPDPITEQVRRAFPAPSEAPRSRSATPLIFRFGPYLVADELDEGAVCENTPFSLHSARRAIV